MGVVWREETKFMQTWTSAYLITYPAARGLPNHHESNQWVPSPSQQPAAAASGPRTDVDSFLTRCSLCQHTLQLCHIGLECCWGRNQSLSHPYRSTPLSTRLWTVWAWKQTRPPLSLFHPHSAWAKHSWGATQWHGEEGRGGGGVWHWGDRPLTTGKVITNEHHRSETVNCWRLKADQAVS